MRILAEGGPAIHWREDGEPGGLPVVFANSLGTDLRLWDHVLPHLPRGLRLIRYDLRGHGLSDLVTGPYAMADLSGDAARLMDHLGVRSCLFVGLSIGGLIAQDLAAKRPDLVRALVLSNTAAKIGTAEMWAARIAAVEADGIEAIAPGIMERWFGPAFRAGPDLALWRNMLTRQTGAGYAGCCHAISQTDLTTSSAALDLPVLAIGGALDGATTPDVVRALADLIPGARYEEVADAGHLPCVEAPETYGAILSRFIEEVRDV